MCICMLCAAHAEITAATLCVLMMTVCLCVLQEDIDKESIATFNRRQMLPSAKELSVSRQPTPSPPPTDMHVHVHVVNIHVHNYRHLC